jgi:uncharacterized protein (TIGR02145 family)
MKTLIQVVVIALLPCLLVNVIAQPYEGEKGDVNADGTINVLDILSVVNHILGIVILDEQGSWRADCNESEGSCTGDGIINIMDALKIVNIILGNDACGNTRPTAFFTVNPATGTTEAMFNVDASGSSDNEDSTASLEVRWDWENDGTYDTDWSTTKTNSHQYSTIGDKIIKLEVKDSGGLLDTETRPVTVIPDSNTVTDIDGNVYHTITIGTQVWMVEDLKTTRYRNGDPIAHITDNTAWNNAITGAYCNYDNNASNASTYGRLYNWAAVNDVRNIAPVGSHIASNAEWITLVNFLGGLDVAGGKMKEAGTAHWWEPNNGATNESGFTALPGGYRVANGTFFAIGVAGIWWSSSEFDGADVWTWHLDYNYAWILHGTTNKAEGISVRCIMD